MARNYAALPHEYLEEMSELDDAEFGRLARALLRYSMNGEQITSSGNERFYAKRVMAQEDRFQNSYADNGKNQKKSEAGLKGAQARWGKRESTGDQSEPESIGAPEDGDRDAHVNGEDSTAVSANSNDGNDSNAISANGNAWQNGYTETKTNTETNSKANINTISSAASPIVALPLNDGTTFAVFQEDVDRWRELYPAVDVMQELRSMAGWCEANPRNRKTKSGAKRFINGWLARAQNRGGNRTNSPPVQQGQEQQHLRPAQKEYPPKTGHMVPYKDYMDYMLKEKAYERDRLVDWRNMRVPEGVAGLYDAVLAGRS